MLTLDNDVCSNYINVLRMVIYVNFYKIQNVSSELDSDHCLAIFVEVFGNFIIFGHVIEIKIQSRNGNY